MTIIMQLSQYYSIPVCVNEGGGDVGGGMGGRVSGSCRHCPVLPSPPWSGTAAAGTSLVGSWGYVPRTLLWC